MASALEIERKYDVDDHATTPRFGGIAEVDEPVDVHLEAEYFDTEDGTLAAQRIVLRRRSGGADEGWHIKIPAPGGRREFHWPLSDGPVPDEALDQVQVHLRGRELRPIARLSTRRTLTHLLGSDGAPVVEFADDAVSASDLGTGILRIWREWEIELVGVAAEDPGAYTRLLDAVEARLLDAGATPAASASKLASALGRTSLSESDPGHRDPEPPLTRSTPIARVVGAALTALSADLVLLDPAVRRNEHDSVHKMRTKIRRLRSLLASFPACFDSDRSRHLRSELGQLGLVLGDARDAEVMSERARALAADHPDLDPAVERALSGGWESALAAGRTRALSYLSDRRYFALLDALEEFVAHPPLGPAAAEPGGEAAATVLRAEYRRIRGRARTADAATGPERVELLHETRKAAKRLRYTAEALSEGPAAIFGQKVARLADAAEGIHDLLGEHRDSVLLQQYLRETAGSGDHAFGFGVLYESERHGAALCLAELPAALAQLKKVKVGKG